MNKLVLIFCTIICLGYTSNAQKKLQLRVSLGNGKPLSSNRKIFSTEENPTVTFDKYTGGRPTYNKITNRILTIPQIGFMLEYKLNKSDIIGIGIQAGKTELDVIVNTAFDHSSASIKKIGMEYTHTFFLKNLIKSTNKFAGRIYISALVGVFGVNHIYHDYTSGTFILTTKDINGNTIDSISSKSLVLNKHGFILSGGLRFGCLNKKNREKISLTFLYDNGFINLWQLNHYSYYNYLQDHINTSMVAKGSQFKIYLSMPIGIYDFDKRKLKRRSK